ncbi:hypothetical protein PMZ80_009943 [Knufia obscura]|uniref:Uncharacterized protein n=1 Tax=Knufia obscura TaxID=1635080 RepID=A0ABR0RB34_9EURO|nr:hypothetical protein PMZ80_009943 [Knufia obscura]
MMKTDTEEIGSTPTLMSIPPECRTYILQLAIDKEPAKIKVMTTTKSEEPHGFSRVASFTHIPHPLLLVSRQIHKEASQFYGVTLMITNNSGKSDDEETLPDDYRNNISPPVRRLITNIVVNGLAGYQGHHVNQDQFPNLKVVTVEALIGKLPSMGHERYIHTVNYSFRPAIHFDEVWSRSHDETITATARRAADEYTMVEVPDARHRTFKILCHTAINVVSTPALTASGSNRIYIDPVYKSTTMNIVWNYDTGEMLRKTELRL